MRVANATRIRRPGSSSLLGFLYEVRAFLHVCALGKLTQVVISEWTFAHATRRFDPREQVQLGRARRLRLDRPARVSFLIITGMPLALTRPQWYRLVYDRLRRIRFVTRSLSLASVLIHIL